MRKKLDSLINNFAIAYLILLLPVVALDDEYVLVTYLTLGLLAILAQLVNGLWLMAELLLPKEEEHEE